MGAVKEFSPYLYGFSFTVLTDHNLLTSLKGIKDTGGRITRWLMFLQQFKFDIKHKQGTKYVNADALSRQPPVLASISTVIYGSSLLANTNKLIQSQKQDLQLLPVYDHIEQGTPLPKYPPGLRDYFLNDGVLCQYYKEPSIGMVHVQFVIPQVLRDTVIKKIHGLGHLGIRKTLDGIKSRCFIGQAMKQM